MLTVTCDRCAAEVGKGVRDGHLLGSRLPIIVFDEKTRRLKGAVEKDLCDKCAKEFVAMVTKWWPFVGDIQDEWNKTVE